MSEHYPFLLNKINHESEEQEAWKYVWMEF